MRQLRHEPPLDLKTILLVEIIFPKGFLFLCVEHALKAGDEGVDVVGEGGSSSDVAWVVEDEEAEMIPAEETGSDRTGARQRQRAKGETEVKSR
jgi:hypothetical protein